MSILFRVYLVLVHKFCIVLVFGCERLPNLFRSHFTFVDWSTADIGLTMHSYILYSKLFRTPWFNILI